MFVFSDSHIHIAHIDGWSTLESDTEILREISNPVCTAAHSEDEFRLTEKIAGVMRNIFVSFGIHPQNPDISLAPFLETLLKESRINAIGEAGFDLFTAEYKADIMRQKDAWEIQLECAARFQKPLVIHCRKALHLIFEDAKRLTKIPVCVFHSFAGSPLEAQSLLKRGINAYFSFGKPLLNNNKRAIACARELEWERLLLETDAPYQRIKGETHTVPRDIIRVHNELAKIKNMSLEQTTEKISHNFFTVFT